MNKFLEPPSDNVAEINKSRHPFEKLYVSLYKELQCPEMIEWFPAYLCNSKCQYCGGYDQQARDEFEGVISYETMIKIIEDSSRSGVNVWNIGGRGGEPLLYPNLTGVLSEIKKDRMSGILITNGLLLNESTVTNFIDIKWDILRISLDSHLAETHDEIRGIRGNFDKIDKALQRFKELKKQRNARLPNIICCPVISNKNYKHISEYITYCIEKGVDEIQFMPLINVHERAERLMLSDIQKEELVDLLEKNISENRIKHNISFFISLYTNKNYSFFSTSPALNNAGSLYCIHLWKTLVISEDGYLSPCSLIKDKLLRIKGLFLEAWNSNIMDELRRKILKGELINPACKDCCGPLRNETDNFNQYLLKRNTSN